MATCPEFITTDLSRTRILARAFEQWFDLDAAGMAATWADLCRTPRAPDDDSLRARMLRSLVVGPAADAAPWDALCAEALRDTDSDAAAVAGLAAVDRLFAGGRALAPLGLWDLRLAELTAEGGLSTRAAAAVALRRGLVAWVLRGDARAARAQWDAGLVQAEAAGAEGLQLALTAMCCVADCLGGALTRADVVASDAWVLCAALAPCPVPQALVGASLGLVRLMLGRADDALTALRQVAGLAGFDSVPEVLRVSAWSLGMLAAAEVGEAELLCSWSRAVADRTVPRPQPLLHACRHYVLGAIALRQGDALRARIHAEACIRAGDAAGALLPVRIGSLLRVQALADLQDAGATLRTEVAEGAPVWMLCGMERLAAVAQLELAAREARAGELDRSRRAWFTALAALPPGETLRPLNRSVLWLETLRSLLFPVAEGLDAPGTAVRIRTLGEFSVEIGGRRIFDRDWKGRRTKTLLMALICEGGSKVSLDRLADLLWPDSDGAQAHQNLKVALWRLRRLGGAGVPDLNWVHVKQGRVSLPAGLVDVDALEFRQAARAGLVPGAADAQVRAALAFPVERFLPMEDDLPWVTTFRDGLLALRRALQARLAGNGADGVERVARGA